MTSPLGSHSNLTEVTQEALDLQRKRRLPIPLRLLVALAALIGIGTGLLLLPWMTTQPISFMDALFTSTSASAVTGLSVLTTSTAFTRLGQWVILLLMEFGGLGFLVTAVLTLRLLGRRISLVDRLAVSSSLGLASPRAIMQVLGRTVAFMLVVEGIGDRALARPAQAGEPDDAALVPFAPFALSAGDLMIVPGDVGVVCHGPYSVVAEIGRHCPAIRGVRPQPRAGVGRSDLVAGEMGAIPGLDDTGLRRPS